MRKPLLGVIFIVAICLVAGEAEAGCVKCCNPPPYTAMACCGAICGATACSASGNFCHHPGDVCSDNDEYCGGGGGTEPVERWAMCAPPLSERWTLVAVKVERRDDAPRTANPKRG